MKSILLTVLILVVGKGLFAQSPHCVPTVGPQPGDSIGLINVKLQGIDRTSAPEEGYQAYYLTDTTYLERGKSYSITLTGGYDKQFTVARIDFDQTFSFFLFPLPTDEILRDTIYKGIPKTFNFTVPANAAVGYTRLRISSQHADSAGIDNSFICFPISNADLKNGDVEDYTIVIVDSIPMIFDSSRVVQQFQSGCGLPGKLDQPIVKVKISTNGVLSPALAIQSIKFGSSTTSNLSDIANAKVWYTGSVDTFNMNQQFGPTLPGITNTFSVSGNQALLVGDNYFWLTYDINSNATAGDFVDASCLEIAVDSASNIILKEPTDTAPCGVLIIDTLSVSKFTKKVNTWYFGTGGLDFNCSPPVPIMNSGATYFEGGASISDDNGNLLFHTNNSAVFDRTQKVMPNGNGLLGNNSTTQGSLIVPQPDNDSIYFVFTVDDVSGSSGVDGFRYSIVNMNLNGGLGDVEPATKNTLLFAPTTEKITAVHHCNGKDIWVLGSQYNSDTLFAYLVTSTGIQAPIKSATGNTITGFGYGGGMKFSPDGSKLAYTIGGIVFFGITGKIIMYNFDNSTGVITYAYTLNPFYASGSSYGLSFSSDNSKIYLGYGPGEKIYYYDVCLSDSSQVKNSLDSLVYTGSAFLGSMQNAPDGNIYMSDNLDIGFIHRIINPNSATPIFEKYGQTVNCKASGFSIPSFVESYFNNSIIDTLNLGFSNNIACFGDTMYFTDTTPLSTGCNIPRIWYWNFGEPLSGLADTSSSNTPYHVYSKSGDYVISLIISEKCQSDTIVKTITIPFVASTNNDTAICEGENVQLGDTSYSEYGYTWTSNPIGYSSTNPKPIVVADSSISYLLTMIDSISLCTSNDTIVITVNQMPLVNITTLKDTICVGDSILLLGSGNGIHQWAPSTGLSDDTILNPVAQPISNTTYILSVNNLGCTDADSITIAVKNLPVASITKDTIICEGNSVQLLATGGDSYVWLPGSDLNDSAISNPIATPTLTTNYLLLANNQCGTDTGSIMLKVTSCDIFIPNAFTPNGDGINDVFQIKGEGVSQFLLIVYDRWGNKVFESKDINEQWLGINNNEGVYVYRLEISFLNANSFVQKGNVTLIR